MRRHGQTSRRHLFNGGPRRKTTDRRSYATTAIGCGLGARGGLGDRDLDLERASGISPALSAKMPHHSCSRAPRTNAGRSATAATWARIIAAKAHRRAPEACGPLLPSGTPPWVISPSRGGSAKTASSTRCSGLCTSLQLKCPVPAGSGSGTSLPSASARKHSRYQAAARVWYFSRMGMSRGTPCESRKSWKRLLPPSRIILKWIGFHESMVVDCT
mmetsp:Transcript_56878/g.165171  ORF Transcript_56878/g.165171 Transcript_56878/m.165171 type:complete len:216 (-) Transcript_56878:269-916(-)